MKWHDFLNPCHPCFETILFSVNESLDGQFMQYID